MNETLVLELEKGIFKADDGREIEYVKPYIIVMGIRIDFIVPDKTAKQIMLTLAEQRERGKK